MAVWNLRAYLSAVQMLAYFFSGGMFFVGFMWFGPMPVLPVLLLPFVLIRVYESIRDFLAVVYTRVLRKGSANSVVSI